MENRRYRHEYEDKFGDSENSQESKKIQKSKKKCKLYLKRVNLEVTKLSIRSTDPSRFFVVKDLKRQVSLATHLQSSVQSKINLLRFVDTLASMPSALTFVWAFILFGGAFAFVVILVVGTWLAINHFIDTCNSLVSEWVFHGKTASHGDRCFSHWN